MSKSNGIDIFTNLELDMIDSHNTKLITATQKVDNMILKKLVLELVSAIENGVEDQEIKYAEKVVNDNEELIKEIRK